MQKYSSNFSVLFQTAVSIDGALYVSIHIYFCRPFLIAYAQQEKQLTSTNALLDSIFVFSKQMKENEPDFERKLQGLGLKHVKCESTI
jgi:hypothetical protein